MNQEVATKSQTNGGQKNVITKFRISVTLLVKANLLSYSVFGY